MSAGTKKTVAITLVSVILTAALAGHAWLVRNQYEMSAQVAANLAAITEIRQIQARWENGYALDRRIAQVEGSLGVIDSLSQRVSSIDDRVGQVALAVNDVVSDVSWMREQMREARSK